MSIWSDFMGHNGRPIAKWKHYFPAYERHLARYVNRPVRLLEIGVDQGGSLQLWKRFLGPYAQIVGVDVKPECANYDEDQISIRIGSQADEAFLATVLDEFGTFDIIIDDGSHLVSDQGKSFKFLYPKMDERGVYAIEDLHTSYWPHFGGGLRHEDSFLELLKTLIDELHGRYISPDMRTAFTDGTLSMHFYDSIAILERGRLTNRVTPVRPTAPGRGGMTFEDGSFQAIPEGKH